MANPTDLLNGAAAASGKINEVAIADLQSQLTEMSHRYEDAHERLVESVYAMDRMMDNTGWSDISQYADSGPSLSQLKNASRQLRNLVALNPLVKRGARLRIGNVWNGGIHYDGIPGARQGRGTNVQELIDLPQNQRAFFGNTAHEERETALYCDSQQLYIGDDKTHELRQFYFSEVSEVYRNPENIAEIWAYRREWTSYTVDKSVGTTKAMWYFTNLHFDKKLKSIKYNDKVEPVSQTERVFGDVPVNSMPGWAFGIPDALSMVSYVRMYIQFVQSGKIVSDALAQIIFQAKSNSQTGANNASMSLGTRPGAGGIATIGTSNDISAMATAGRGYDFNSGRPMASLAATAIEVSVISLLSDPSAAGSSYGASQTLSKPEQDATVARRQYHIDLEKEVLAWMGAKDAEVWFDPIIDMVAFYRGIQSIMLKWGSGLYTAKQAKKELEELSGRTGTGEIPEGVLLPNNRASWERADIDPKDGPSGGSAANGGSFTPTRGSGSSANQGQGTSQNASDTRTDQIAQSHRSLDFNALVENFGKMIDEMEAERGDGAS